MNNVNKKRLIMKFIVRYPFNYEDEYRKIQIKIMNINSEDYDSIGRVFDEHQDYIIDYFTSEFI
jgi:hypothetical protein